MAPQTVETKKNTIVLIFRPFGYENPGPRVLHLDDVKIIYTENIIILVHGPDKKVLVERKFDVASIEVRRLD